MAVARVVATVVVAVATAVMEMLEKMARGSMTKGHIKCFKCHLYGHYANRCPSEKKEEEAHHVKTVEYEPIVLLAKMVEPGQLDHLLSEKVQEELLLNEVHLDTELHFTSDGESCGELWYLDNGASNHMTSDR